MIGVIVPVRLDSSRLPQKALRPIQDRPLLGHVLTRCRAVGELDGRVFVATTSRSLDDPIEAFCKAEGVDVFRGALEDVAGRALHCAKERGLTWFARVNGDSPFTDPALLGEACRIARTGDWDFVTNLYPRSFPYGVSVELIRTQTYEMMYGRMSDSEDLEHVTRALYRHMADFRYFNIERKGDDLSGVRLTVDTEADLAMMERLLEVCGKRLAYLSYLEAVQVYEKLRSN